MTNPMTRFAENDHGMESIQSIAIAGTAAVMLVGVYSTVVALLPGLEQHVADRIVREQLVRAESVWRPPGSAGRDSNGAVVAMGSGESVDFAGGKAMKDGKTKKEKKTKGKHVCPPPQVTINNAPGNGPSAGVRPDRVVDAQSADDRRIAASDDDTGDDTELDPDATANNDEDSESDDGDDSKDAESDDVEDSSSETDTDSKATARPNKASSAGSGSATKSQNRSPSSAGNGFGSPTGTGGVGAGAATAPNSTAAPGTAPFNTPFSPPVGGPLGYGNPPQTFPNMPYSAPMQSMPAIPPITDISRPSNAANAELPQQDAREAESDESNGRSRRSAVSSGFDQIRFPIDDVPDVRDVDPGRPVMAEPGLVAGIARVLIEMTTRECGRESADRLDGALEPDRANGSGVVRYDQLRQLDERLRDRLTEIAVRMTIDEIEDEHRDLVDAGQGDEAWRQSIAGAATTIQQLLAAEAIDFDDWLVDSFSAHLARITATLIES